MAEKIWNKGNITFLPVVESINRKFALRREVSGNKTVGKKIIGGYQFMGAGTRTMNLAHVGLVSKNYFWMRKYGRGTPVTANETAQRQRFAACSAWVSAAMKDLAVVTQNNAKFKQIAQDPTLTIYGISAGGYTYRGFMFAYAHKYATAEGDVPTTHALPNPA